jgi:hypothetical protein
MHGNNIKKGKSLCSYLYLKLAKHHVSPFILYIFSSTNSENRRAEQILPGVKGEGWHQWEGGCGAGKGLEG